ncbi:putative lipid II flippase FtsW [Elusimicrobiota bacterium]
MAKKRINPTDSVLLTCFVILVVFGLLMVLSSSSILALAKYQDPYHFFKRQVVFCIAGVIAAAFCSRLNLETWRKGWLALFATAFILLIIVLIAGKTVGGARRWLYLGPIGFQPSELARFAFIVAFARYADRYHSKMDSFLWSTVYPLLIFLTLTIPIAMEPDFGGPFLMGLVFVSLLCAVGVRWRHLAIYPVLAIPVITALIIESPYRVQRILSFLNIWGVNHPLMHTANTDNYQLTQAMLALGSGGFFGKGLGGSELKLHYLPQPHTDFIFPVIGEELGFLGAVAVIVLFLLITYHGVKTSIYAKKMFSKVLALGITFSFAFQAAIHIAVTTALAPTKGITLPFLSYGGSSLMMSLIMAGVLLRISRENKQ